VCPFSLSATPHVVVAILVIVIRYSYLEETGKDAAYKRVC